MSRKDILVKLSILLLLCHCTTCLIIPEELPTILSLVYSNIPPIKKGTDSRVGVGFRLGEHADFQVLVELGPQSETNPIGNTDAKRRRDAMLSAAMKGELGPLAQAVAKYQMERKLQKELERLKKVEEKLKKIRAEENADNKTVASEWLASWSKDMMQQSEEQLPLSRASVDFIDVADPKSILKRVERPIPLEVPENNQISNLTKLYKLQPVKKIE